MAGCKTKKYAKGGSVRKSLKMADGGLVPPMMTTGLAPTAMTTAAPVRPPIVQPGPGVGPQPPSPGKMEMEKEGPEYGSSRPPVVQPGPGVGPMPRPPGKREDDDMREGRRDMERRREMRRPERPERSEMKRSENRMEGPRRGFKKGGMVNAKSSGTTVRPRGASGRGVKACKVC